MVQSARGCGDQDGLCSEVGEVGNRTKVYNNKEHLRIMPHQGKERQERNDRMEHGKEKVGKGMKG